MGNCLTQPAIRALAWESLMQVGAMRSLQRVEWMCCEWTDGSCVGIHEPSRFHGFSDLNDPTTEIGGLLLLSGM